MRAGPWMQELAGLAPHSYRRMGENPHANGGLLLRDLDLPDFRAYAVEVGRPGGGTTEGTRPLGRWLRDVIRGNPATSGCSARTRRPPTGCRTCSR